MSVDIGTFYENISFDDKRITVGSQYLTTKNKLYIFKTIIDGSRNIETVVLFDSGEDKTSVLCEFTITNGTGYSGCGAGREMNGGGITCEESSHTLSNLLIIRNSGIGGGRILLEESNLILIDITIKENTAISGGGICLTGREAGPRKSGVSVSIPKFDSVHRCNIYNNNASYGRDLYSLNDTLMIHVIVGTFTVSAPDSVYAYPLNDFSFDILHPAVTGINSRVKNLPINFTLFHNYPNPFNLSTTIEFTLPKSEFVELKVFNILGKKLSTLVSKKLNPGNHT